MAVDIEEIPVAEEARDDALLELAAALAVKPDEPTLIYCVTPRSAHRVARSLVEADLALNPPDVVQAVNWLSRNYHPEWMFARALRAGIGVHHGRIPRSLGRYVVDLFNDRKLPFLVCTSTLIQGVNTVAKNVIVYDDAIGERVLDAFTFNNIKGRAGRMRHYYVGRVFVLFRRTSVDLPAVDVPAVTQERAPRSC